MCRHCESNATVNSGSTSPAPVPFPMRGDLLPLCGEQIPLPLFGEDVGYLLPEIANRDINGNEIEEELFECSSCSEKLPEDELMELNDGSGGKVCCGCASSCDACGKVFTSDSEYLHPCSDAESYRRHNADSICCEECSWQCADCSDWFYGDAQENSSGEKICSRCSENYSSCEECNDIIHNDYTFYDDVDERTLCASCMRDVERERENDENDEDDEDSSSVSRRSRRGSLIQKYSYKPAPLFKFAQGEKDSSPVTFYGIEIECEKSEANHDNAIRSSGLADDDVFYCKHDGSVQNGFEIVSHPCTLRYWREHSFAFATKLAAAGYDSGKSESCGMHIHFSRSALSPAQVAKLLLFTKQNSGFMRFVSRRVNIEKMNYYAPCESGSTGDIVRKAAGESADRYSAVNLENEKTIEIRIFQGSLAPEVIRLNVAFVATLIEFIRSAPLSQMSRQDFRDSILKSGRKLLGQELSSSLIKWIDSYTSSP